MPPKKKLKKKKKVTKGATGPASHGISEQEALPPVIPSPRAQALLFSVSINNVSVRPRCYSHFPMLTVGGHLGHTNS
jgi:hypothetical protein